MLMERIAGWIFGKVQFSAEGGAYEKMLNHCTEMGLTLAGLQPTALGVKGWMPARDYKKIHRAAHHCHCRVRILRRRGLPFLLKRYRGRWGLLLGPALFLALCLYFSGTLWCVRYYDVPWQYQVEIDALLKENGILPGCRPTEQDLARARQTILMQSDTLADLSLNFIKGRLVVEVAPRTQKPDLEQYAPGSVVAAKGGIIDHLEVEHGFAVVGAGQRVEAGDLLITGVYIDEKTENVVITPAQGVVVARTETVYQSAQPLQFTAHIPTGEVIEYRTLIMGGRRIPLSLQPEEPVLFSQEVRSEPVSLFGFALPAVLETRSLYPEKETQIQLTEQQAAERARFLLDRALESESDTEEILQRSFDGQLTDGVFYATLTVERLENIAVSAS